MSASDSEPTILDVLEASARDARDTIQGGIPASIVSYDPATRSATVSPLVYYYRHGNLVTLKAIQSVPVAMPIGALGGLTIPLQSGDTGVLTIGGADIGQWHAGSGSPVPPSPRRFAIGDVVFVPGVVARSPAQAATSYSSQGPVLSGAHVYLCSSAAADFAARASLVDARLDALEAWAASHVHPAGGTLLDSLADVVTGTTGAVVSSPSGGPTGSTKVHLD